MTSATAHVPPDGAGAFTRRRSSFQAWRHTRPFWGGLLACIAGVPILALPYAQLPLGGLTIAMATTGGAGALIIGVLMIVLGICAWTQPLIRTFAGVAVILLTLVAIPVSNLAGFGLGLIPGLFGGALLVSWAPLSEEEAAAQDLDEAYRNDPAANYVADPAATYAAEQPVEYAAEQPTADEQAPGHPADGRPGGEAATEQFSEQFGNPNPPAPKNLEPGGPGDSREAR